MPILGLHALPPAAKAAARPFEQARDRALLPFAFSRAPPLLLLGSGGCPSLLGGLRQIESICLSFNLRDTAAEKICDVVDGASTGKSAIQVE
jgi:hypothetical protein